LTDRIYIKYISYQSRLYYNEQQMNNLYTINDLYTAAFLRARGHECTIDQSSQRRFSFSFQEEARVDAHNFISKGTEFNVNSSKLINEIKALKSYISNNI